MDYEIKNPLLPLKPVLQHLTKFSQLFHFLRSASSSASSFCYVLRSLYFEMCSVISI